MTETEELKAEIESLKRQLEELRTFIKESLLKPPDNLDNKPHNTP